MMCDECGIRPANIRLTTIVNGEKQERNLCGECLSKDQKLKLDFTALANHLSGFIEAAKAGGAVAQVDPNLACPRCGTTYETFRKTGMLGCANCYSAFREQLAALLKRTHGQTQHVGHVPGGVNSPAGLKNRIDRLKRDLVEAIAGEEYETAATLRDEIRALRSQLEEGGARE